MSTDGPQFFKTPIGNHVMRFVNMLLHTAAQPTSFFSKEGGEHLLVVLKATYGIPPSEDMPCPVLAPIPLAVKDVYAGEPGFSAPLYENDFAARKAQCDVVFNANAYAPSGRPVKELDVLARVGSMCKHLRVVGNRRWEKDLFIIRSSRPQPFTSMPLHYGYAFGGTVLRDDGIKESDSLPANPVGTGYSGRSVCAEIHGMPLPNLERPNKPLRRPDEHTCAPIALSAIGRNFFPRYTYAGTYDKQWQAAKAPFLPDDFDEHFFQCAPEDQRIDFPQGGEEVQLRHLSPDRPEIRFHLPPLGKIPINILRFDLSIETVQALPDTLYFEPDACRFSVVWRGSAAVGHKGLREVRLCTVGALCHQWLKAVQAGSTGCDGCPDAAGEYTPPDCPANIGISPQKIP